MKKLPLLLSSLLVSASLCVGAPAIAFAEDGSLANGDVGISLLAGDIEARQLRTQREAYVTSLYANVLGRVPSAVEVSHHADEIERGRSLGEVALIFFGGDEFANRGFTSSDAAQVAYVSLLGRSASAYELEIRGGHIDEYGIAFVVGEVLRSPEFESHFESLAKPVEKGMGGLATRLDRYLMSGTMSASLRSQIESASTAVDGLVAVLTSVEFTERGFSERQIAQLVAYALTDTGYAGQQIGEVAAYRENGMSEYKLIDGIMQKSPNEVGRVMGDLGVKRGDIVLTEPRDQDINVSGFATRLYTCVLGRTPDVAGLNVQCQALLDGSEAVAITRNYFISDEFARRGLSNEECVRIAYNTMLNREPEPVGLAYWTKYLDSHMNLSSVLRGFSQAKEWNDLCAAWGLKSGTLVLEEPRDQRMEVAAFVSRLYENVLGRDPDIPGLNVQCEALLNGMPAADLAYNFFMSAEFLTSGRSVENQVTVAYNTLLDREPDQYGLEGWSACMHAGMPLEYLVAGFADSDEFGELCGQYGIERGWLYYDPARMAEYTKVVTPPAPTTPTTGGTTTVAYNLTVDQMLALNYPYIPEYLGYSEQEVRNAIDPSTVSGSAYYQFGDLRQLSGLTASQIDAYIASTPNGRAGTMAGQGAAIVQACREANLNEVYALCHAILETGWGTSDLASGYYYDGTTPVGGQYYPAGTYYNYFGIGAYDSGALSGGRAMAIKNGWNSPSAALAGGIAWIARNYTYASSYPQVTIYEMKWDPQRASDTQLYGWHQFATGIVWPETISSIMGHCLAYAGLGADSFSYIVPQYR